MDRIPLTRPAFTDRELMAIGRVLKTGFVSQGPEVALFEQEVADFLGGGLAVAVSSGSAAIYVALRAVGVGRGDQVIVPAFSHPAPAYAVVMAGGIPVPVDTDPQTLSLDLDKVPSALTSMTKAVIIVDGLGAQAPVQKLRGILGNRPVSIIEDAACGLGMPDVGKYADIATFSLHPRKVITSGEGGFVFTHDAVLAESSRKIRNFGLKKKGFGPIFDDFGFNFRFNDILAAVARVQLSRLPEMREKRGRLVADYLNLLHGVDSIDVPKGLQTDVQAFQTMAVQTPVPGPELVDIMSKRGVEVSATAHNLAEQPFFMDLWSKMSMQFQCPIAQQLARDLVALPLGVSMTRARVDIVVNELKEAVYESTRGSN